MEASLLEAAASVGLEEERISPRGLVLRLTGNLAAEEDPRASGRALRILSMARRPGDPFGAPAETIRRIEAAARPFGQPQDETDVLEEPELALVATAGRVWAEAPVLARWRVVADYACRSRRASPGGRKAGLPGRRRRRAPPARGRAGEAR